MYKDNDPVTIYNKDGFIIQELHSPKSAMIAHNSTINKIQISDKKNNTKKFNAEYYGCEKCNKTFFTEEMHIYKAQREKAENELKNKTEDKYDYSFCTTLNINNFHIIQNTQVTKVNAVEIGNLLSTGKFMGRRLLTEILDLEELKNVRYIYAKIHKKNKKCIELFESLNFKKQDTNNSKNNFETYVLDREAQENNNIKNKNKNFTNKNTYNKSKNEKNFQKNKGTYMNF